MQDNRIDAALSETDRAAVLAAIETIKTKLPFLIDLTPKERQELPKMGDKTQAFVFGVATLVSNDGSFLPRNFDEAAFAKDVALVKALQGIRQELLRLAELVDDTAVAVGSEAYVAALVAYRAAQENGRGEGLDELLDELGRRFAKVSKPSPKP
ncbi:hypothetical protein [Armatimonas sp.]|uniref:hypothetical protein n=1 Tax=Armatimonas sp. TaxID=1872638 RepID=UPI00286CE833|nr:hypothetical protein [Armatimonas sp.]MCX6366458.1 hypothetical protein [Armatimonadota bacterium]